MNYPIVVLPWLKVYGMALWPVILVGDKNGMKDSTLLNHEHIHLRQQAELLVLPFYFIYLLNYLINLAVYRGHNQAYLNIIFEREAYQMERNPAYLETRRWYSWINYF